MAPATVEVDIKSIQAQQLLEILYSRRVRMPGLSYFALV